MVFRQFTNRSRILYTGCLCSFYAAKERVWERKISLRFLILSKLLLLVNGHSMEPTIEHNSLIIIRPFFAGIEKLSKNDVIVAEDPEQEGKTILKRITHLAGERAYWRRRVYLGDGWEDVGEVEVPNGCVWVEGDNKERSIDSRFGLSCSRFH
ncbi:Oidioi.mRNA.OKI2018_I69.XSR.g13323.t1.cds [Oikopleura dioica]|uniref:IMP2-like protein n=1 Tax=Oikopleura dioica TaxID=34765 RepID=A0ABN7SBQ5_OIKDI|nr:Oidioi.mRNA.OKI2018_I69.XSR.g13323.t1.cds [Oikopleura dioica]